ncbi:MAG TPA: glycerol-3-phosphate dehydrogenase, partial [Rhodospirillales bacterium]|nr:glycerol-3-phosphate dehydrogenase [Rhodospirillales bacterium]
MREGSLEAPTRHPIPWRDEAFYDAEKLDAELRRVFDICHGCRRCFNLCDSFPRLFDLIDEAKTGELDSVDSAGFKSVVEACTLCDMCFLTKCPYVPPHDFDLDFPHLMLRYRAVEHRAGKVGFIERQMTETDRNGRLARTFSGIANWGMDTAALRGLAGIARDAALPKFNARTFEDRARANSPKVNADAPAHGRKAVIYATCFANYNIPAIGMAALNVLAINGVETVVVHPECCGMPQLEHGDIGRVAKSASRVSAEMKGWIEKGYDVVSLISSCSLMLKFEWPLILPENDDVKRLSAATFDIAEYVVDIASKEGLADGLVPLDGDVTLHIACHARAQNMGRKGAELLSKIPDTKIDVIERCSGHGGSWGVMKDNFEVALKVGKPVARQAVKNKPGYVVSECPLARDHILQGMERLDGDTTVPGLS